MRDILTSEDRREIRTTLFASLAVVFTLVLSPLAWAGVNPPAAESRVARPATALSAASGPAEETSNAAVGCGCAEACLAAD